MTRRWVLTLACFALTMHPVVSRGARAPETRCGDGTWTIDAGPTTVGPLEIHSLEITAGVPSVTQFCRAQRWGLVRTGELRALFACRDPERGLARFPLRLRALMSDGCTHVQGAFAIRRRDAIAQFTATKTGSACTSNDDCTAEAFCQHPVGECTAEGRCAVRPWWGCFGAQKLSCGCDGQTHGSCDAAKAGINLADFAPCTTSCGGLTGVPCSDGEFCDLPAGTCGSADLEGQCVSTGGACPEYYLPVCGCDGVTYPNDCFRQVASAQKAHDGACESVCGGIAGIPCRPGEVCDLPPGTCASADLQGQCMPIGPCTQQYDPVCGCDGKTYGNDCERRSAGVQLSHLGACT